MTASKLREFTPFQRLPYDIRRQIWLYVQPEDNWKLERHAEHLRDVLSGKDYGTIAQFKNYYPSPWASLGANPESRRIAFELLKKKIDELEERTMQRTPRNDQARVKLHASVLSINIRGHLVYSTGDEFDDDIEGPQFFGQELDDLVFWDWRPRC